MLTILVAQNSAITMANIWLHEIKMTAHERKDSHCTHFNLPFNFILFQGLEKVNWSCIFSSSFHVYRHASGLGQWHASPLPGWGRSTPDTLKPQLALRSLNPRQNWWGPDSWLQACQQLLCPPWDRAVCPPERRESLGNGGWSQESTFQKPSPGTLDPLWNSRQRKRLY